MSRHVSYVAGKVSEAQYDVNDLGDWTNFLLSNRRRLWSSWPHGLEAGHNPRTKVLNLLRWTSFSVCSLRRPSVVPSPSMMLTISPRWSVALVCRGPRQLHQPQTFYLVWDLSSRGSKGVKLGAIDDMSIVGDREWGIVVSCWVEWHCEQRLPWEFQGAADSSTWSTYLRLTVGHPSMNRILGKLHDLCGREELEVPFVSPREESRHQNEHCHSIHHAICWKPYVTLVLAPWRTGYKGFELDA